MRAATTSGHGDEAGASGDARLLPGAEGSVYRLDSPEESPPDVYGPFLESA